LSHWEKYGSPTTVPRIDIPDFDLSLTLRSGQFFRYRPANGGFEIATHGRLLCARQAGERLSVEGADGNFVRSFFGLDTDLEAVRAALERDPVLRPLLSRLRGLRLLRQEPWECAVAFICSSCSNIPRITRNLEDLARRFGPPVALDGRAWHALPRPGAFPDARRLRPVRLGYRARYLSATAAAVGPAGPEPLRRLPLAEARRALRELPGVGEKVAECILLFSLGFGEAFPVDVWIRRAMRRFYLHGRRRPDRYLMDFAAGRFGPHAGYAQQLLYVASRTGA
jgi:N-glycosylase/DNA lyase